MRRVGWLVLLCTIVCTLGFVTLFPERVAAQEEVKKKDFGDQIVVIQLNPFLRKGRFELAPTFHGSFNDSLVQQLNVGLVANYHLLQWLYLGVVGGWQDWRFISDDANGLGDEYERVIDATDAIPEVSVLNAYAGAVVGFVPFYGKLALFNSAIIHWDFNVGLGGGLIHTRASDALGGGIVTLGQRFFLLDWLSLNFDVRGLIYYEELGRTEGLFTQWQAGLGVAFWFPTGFEYESL